jgi:putative transposase
LTFRAVHQRSFRREQPLTKGTLPMDEYESLSHTTWDCKYHVVFIPKCRRRTLYQELRRHLGKVFRRLAPQKESKVEEGHLMPDHVHMLLSIPPKHAVSQVRRVHQGQERHPFGPCLWGAQTQFRRTALLDPRFLRQHDRAGRGGDPRLHSRPRERGSEARTDESLALKNATFRWRQAQGVASATPPTALIGSNHKAPALPGDTYKSARAHLLGRVDCFDPELSRRHEATRPVNRD